MPMIVPLLAVLPLLAATAGAPSDVPSRQVALVGALIDLGEAERRAGRLDDGRRLRDRGFLRAPSPRGTQTDAGDLDGAVAGFEESLRLRERSAYCIYVPPALLALGDAWKQKGDLAKARSLFERAPAEAEAIGAERFRSAAREALAGLEASPPKP